MAHCINTFFNLKLTSSNHNITRNFTAFETARQYASYVGVAPHFHTSGTSVRWRPRPSARRDGQAKANLSMAATVAVQYDAELQSFYNRKLGGKQDTCVNWDFVNFLIKSTGQLVGFVNDISEFHVVHSTLIELNLAFQIGTGIAVCLEETALEH